MADDKELKFEASTEARCPCGKTVSFGQGDYPNGGRGGMAMHELPHCKAYEEKELLDYMRYVRLSLSPPEA